MLTRTLAGRVRPLLAAAGLRGYAPRAAADLVVVGHEEPPPRTASSASAAATVSIAATAPTVLQPRVLIYDGVCHLCHRGVKWVIKADKHAKIRFCCLQSKAAEPYLRLVGMDREDVLRRVLFIEGPEAYYEGSTAALKVASYLPLPYSALSSLLIIPAPLRDAIYDYIAKNRYDWFGKDDECIVTKNKELLERFIDREEMLGGGPSNSF
uniref:Thiol-disulfide oxidoreductase DCC n=1 Tax=Oryza nivara TaxID=4536 RepID=A0A0E0HN85_ORYNI